MSGDATDRDCAFVAHESRKLADNIHGAVAMLGVPRPVRETGSAVAKTLTMLAKRAESVPPWSGRRVVVVGRFSSGKSALINALIEQPDFLPSAMEPLTAFPTFVRYGDGLPEVIVAQTGKKGTVSAENIRYVMDGSIFQQGGKRLRLSKEQDYAKASDLSGVNLYASVPLLRNVESLVDAPGWDNPEANTGAAHTQKANSVMETAHALVLVTNETGLHERDITLLETFLLDPRTTGCPVAVAINKSDLIAPPDAQRVLVEARQRLRARFPLHAPAIATFAVSALESEHPEAFSQLARLRQWIGGAAGAKRLDTPALLHVVSTQVQVFVDAVNAWRDGDFETSWNAGSPEAGQFAAWLADKAKTDMARYAVEAVTKDLRRTGNAPGDLTPWRKLRTFGFESPETLAKSACEAALASGRTWFWSRFIVHCRDGATDFLPIRLGLFAGFAPPDSVAPFSVYRNTLGEWICDTGAALDSDKQRAVLRDRWSNRPDDTRIAELRSLTERLGATLKAAEQHEPPHS